MAAIQKMPSLGHRINWRLYSVEPPPGAVSTAFCQTSFCCLGSRWVRGHGVKGALKV